MVGGSATMAGGGGTGCVFSLQFSCKKARHFAAL